MGEVKKSTPIPTLLNLPRILPLNSLTNVIMKKYFLLLFFGCLGMQAQEPAKTAYAYFDFNSDALTPQATATLDSISKLIGQSAGYSIEVYGFTDDAGTDVYNSVLAQNRAERVAAYFHLHKLRVEEVGPDSPKLRQSSLSPEKKRRARIVYRYTEKQQAVAYANEGGSVNQPSTTGSQGTRVTLSGGIGPGEVAVSEYFSTEDMMEKGMYGIAEGGDILMSDGMVTVCNTYKQIDSTGMYTIEIPATRGVINDKATVWLSTVSKEGKLVWKETSIEVVTNKVTNMYTIKLGAQPQECTHINLDMFANKANGYRVVYLYTDKPYDLRSVKMYNYDGEVSFSAKVNDSTYAFSVPSRTGLAGLRFIGTGKAGPREIGVQLRKCRHKIDKKRNHHYYVTANALAAGLPTEAEKKKKPKGWFEKGSWLSRLFS